MKLIKCDILNNIVVNGFILNIVKRELFFNLNILSLLGRHHLDRRCID